MPSDLAKLEKKVTTAGVVLIPVTLFLIYEAYAVLYILLEIIEKTSTKSTGVAGLAFHLVLFLAVAAFTANRYKHRKGLIELSKEQSILAFAQREKGRQLTITEIALGSELSASDTVKTLRRLAMHGMCEQELNKASEEVYSFVAFQSQPLEVSMEPPPPSNE